MIDQLKKEILNGDNTNVCYSENGAKMNASTGKNLLDLSFKVPQLRGMNPSDKKFNSTMLHAIYENPEMFIRFLFYLRDIRGGLGERYSFRNIFNWLCNLKPQISEKMLEFIPEYGRWDDLIFIALNATNENVKTQAVKIIANQLKADRASENVSLLGKWLPSVNAGKKSAQAAKKLISLINKVYKSNINEAYYRKVASELRRKAAVIERNIAAKTYSEIDYEKVPSLANTRYSNLFLKYDENRRREYLNALTKGEKKINSSVAFPHDIWKMASRDSQTANEMWKALPDYVNGASKVLVVRDGSGSMGVTIPGSTTTAMDVASSLCVYFAEKLTGEFHNKFITFSSHPALVELPDGIDLKTKQNFLRHYNDCSNTNIEATFDLILNTAVNNNMKQEDLPDTLLIVSDMEFDCATAPDYWTRGTTCDAKLFKVIEQKYAKHGYKLPRLVFWNVNSRTGAIPMTENDLGVILISGYSASLCKMVLSNETDPYLALVKQLMVERYNPVIEPIKEDLKSF